ncbi:MAG: NAD(P)H-binding protein [Gemmatimonadota bacterium]|nr:NAD(P)H-binding protein [Gemmatimonadota bacterium]
MSGAPGGDRRVIVTGAAGFVGGYACRALAADGWHVVALVRNAARAAERLGHMPIEIRVGDLMDRAYLRAALDSAHAVVHLAAVAIERDGDSYQTANVDTTAAVLDAAQLAGVRRFVHMSQNGADSASPFRFLQSKGIAQDMVLATGLKSVILRPSVIFGPEDAFVNVIARIARLTPVILPLPGGGRSLFQPIAVADVAAVVARALSDDSPPSGVFGLGGVAALSLRDIAARALVAMNLSRTIVGVPTAMMRPLVAALSQLLPRLPVTTELLDTLAIDNIVADNSITSVFGITPVPFAPEELLYLKRVTAASAFRSLFRA